jgi:hypothetical protein
MEGWKGRRVDWGQKWVAPGFPFRNSFISPTYIYYGENIFVSQKIHEKQLNACS